jgi:plasmid maintenance system killer protein
MFGLLGFSDAAKVGEAITGIAMRKTAILAVRMDSNIATSFGADVISRPERTSGNGLERLTGARDGEQNIRINEQWRVCFG